MMFSTEKCSDLSTGTSEATEHQTGGSEGLGKEGVPPDEVASAVAAVSDEIGDILKDELGDADRADRIGAELAGLSAELGLLAGLADGEPQQDFPSLFEIAMGHRVSGSGSSSSSSWSGGGARRASRPQRAPRRKPIAKGKEMSRRRSAAARRAASLRVRRVEVVSDASDVGADSDSDGQWTELEDACSSDNSSTKEAAPAFDAACNGYQHKGAEAEPPAMGQFLLPLLSAAEAPERTELFIRHEDILQAVRLAPLHLLTSSEDGARVEFPLQDDTPMDQTDSMSEELDDFEEPPVTPEEEAALLHYVCEAERLASCTQPEGFTPVPEWLLGVYHAWCEISALMYTLIGCNMSVEMVREDWMYRARFGCHCRLCLCLANNAEALARWLRPLLSALARDSSTIPTAVALMRALRISDAGAPCRHAGWRLRRLRRLRVPDAGLAVIHAELLKLEGESEMTNEIVNNVCLCRPVAAPLRIENAMERLCQILENFKAASTITFQAELLPAASGAESGLGAWRVRLARYLQPFQRCSTAARLRDMLARPTPHDLSAWAGYRHKCDCLTPRSVCAQQRKLLLRISFFGMMQAVNEFNGGKPEESADDEKPPNEESKETGSRELQQGDGTGAKPPDSTEGQPASSDKDLEQDQDSDDKSIGDLDDLSESDGGSGSLGLSSSSLDSASSLLLAAAAAVDSGGDELAPGSLCRTVRHLMRSIASIERLMDRVLKHCDEWPAAAHCRRDSTAADERSARKRVDMGLSEVDRKLMAMYRRLPEVHRRQLQVYRKQKKLSTVCMQLVGGRAPAPPPPGSPPPPPAHQACRALCPEYHLQRFQEVRRKVMHMRDQQLYYHRLRLWLEQQLRQEKDKHPDSNAADSSLSLVEQAARRRSASPKPKLGAAPKRKLVPPHPKFLQEVLKIRNQLQIPKLNDEATEVDPPEAFPLDKDDESDAETIVGEKETELSKDMKECLVKLANFALNSLDESLQQEYTVPVEELPDSVSPPLQEMSPTTSESMPVYTPKPSQRLLQVNKFLDRDDVIDFQSQITPEILNVPLNARRTPILVEEEGKCVKLDDNKDPNVYKYVTFGLEIKKAMEECQNIINSYNSINKEEGKDEQEGPLSLEQICEVMMSLDKNSAEFLEKIDSEEPININTANTMLAELVENMPQILANMPGIASKLSQLESAFSGSTKDASFELPEFASIMNSLPEVNNEAQLTPDTLRQIRELKLNKNKDNVKVTKNTAKRKTNRRIKRDVDTVTLKCMNVTDVLKDAPLDIHELFNNSVKDALSMDDSRELLKARYNTWKHCVASKFKGVSVVLLENEIEAMLEKFFTYIQDLAEKQYANDSDEAMDKIEYFNDGSKSESDSESCPASKESLKQISKLLSTSAGNTFDLLIMKLSKMSQDKKTSVKSLKFKYMDVVRRCADSVQLTGWILLNPEIASNVIEELTGIPSKNAEAVPDFHSMSEDDKKEYFLDRLKGMNKTYMGTLPKDAFTGDQWLVMLYRLEKLEEKIKESFAKLTCPPKNPPTQASEAEILAAKGLSKIIGKANASANANARVVKKPNTEPPKPKKDEKPDVKETEEEKKCKNEALLAKCEAILTSKGEKSLLDSFYTIKSYITQGLPVPETYKKHVISICSSIDAKLLDDDIQDTLLEEDREKNSLSVIGSQNPEWLAKYSAQALRNAKQTLNAVAFRNMMRNGQTKSESDACDTPKNDCKWTNDCICSSCKDSDSGAVCIGDIVKQCYDLEGKSKSGLEEKKKEVKAVKPAAKPKPVPKACENASHQQHVCKVGHSNGSSACAGDAAADQPCACCYCTVFGHAPPLTTPVPRNFNETRERLRSILNKKKQKCKTANGEVESASPKPAPAQPEPQPPKPKPVPQPPAPKPPFVFQALPKSLAGAAPRRQDARAADAVADQMADMSVSGDKPKALQRTTPVQVNVPPALKAEGKVNPNAMEQIRLQQLKQQQQAQYQQQQAQQQQAQQQQQQQQLQQRPPPAPAPAQKKPEPIYDLPIHNKPTLTPQQQQQIRQQQLQQQQQQQLLQQLQQKQRMSRPAQPSLSSRDTSVFSTSSGCSGITSHSGSCWRGGSGHQDPRDLDALLQYIEGPARHVDRGKKRAKKQRQKGKRMESRLLAEHAALGALLQRMRGELHVFQTRHVAALRTCEDTKAHLKQQLAKRKGKKGKLNPVQQAKAQLVTEQLEKINNLLTATAKEMAESERQVAECAKKYAECERNLAVARALQAEPPRAPHAARHLETAAMLHRQQLQQQQIQQQIEQLTVTDKMDKQKQKAFINSVGAAANRRAESDPMQVLHNGRQLTVLNARPEPPPAEPPRKQTWEQALAHINQLAKGSKEKKKQKEQDKAKAEPKPKEVQRSQSLPDSQPLSKKQRRLLAKQQAEEEERKRQQQLQKQEAKSKKEKEKEKKAEPPKVEPKKAEKKDSKKPEMTKKEEKKEKKKQEKQKENKQEKTVPPPQPATKQTKQQKKEKKEQQTNKPHVINITADTTIEVVSKKTQGGAREAGGGGSCSIMEQLSCGVQVSELRLPPGITLTRVQPVHKKEPNPIKSVPLWKAGALAAAPTPVARPQPVINADPSMMMFHTAQPEPPKTIIVPEPVPQPGRSKKAKKKAKKAAAAAEAEPKTDGTKMVTLRNPMFHPNLPPAANPVKKPEIRIPDPIPMPPNACQATITPTSNGMYTIRNPLMSMMHQQSLLGVSQPQAPMYGQQYNYVNPNTYTPVQTVPNPQAYVLDPSRNSPKQDEFQNRIMNLASFTQKNDEGYSLFKTNEDNQQRNFLTPEYYVENSSPKPVVSPNPIGTRPTSDNRSFDTRQPNDTNRPFDTRQDANRSFDSNDSSLFTNSVRTEPVKQDDYAVYTPFGQEDRNVFRNALFNDKNVPNYGMYDESLVVNGDPLPYFQRLRVGSKLNNEVTIHHVTESKFYKGQEMPAGDMRDESLFSRPWPASYPPNPPAGLAGAAGSPLCAPAAEPDDARFGPVARPALTHLDRAE